MRGLEPMDMETLRAKLNGLATASEKPVFVADKTESGEVIPLEAKNFKAIWNDKENQLATIASKNYTLIQHSTAFGAVLDAITAVKTNPQVKARVEERNGRAWMTVVFEDIIAKDGAQGIEIGLKATNSFDKTSSLKYGGQGKQSTGAFEFFGYRRTCSNGMAIRLESINWELVKPEAEAKAIGDQFARLEAQVIRVDASQSIRHYGQNAIIKLDGIMSALAKLPYVAKNLEERIVEAQSEAIAEKEAGEMLEKLGYCDRTHKRLMEQFEHEEQTRWGLYNAITAYASHTERLSPLAVERELNKAKPLLMTARVIA